MVNESIIRKIIAESINKLLAEKRSIKSKKLFDIINQHGGVETNRGVFDIANMLDEDIIDVVNYSKMKEIYQNINTLNDFKKKHNVEVRDEISHIPLKDGYYIVAINRGARFDRINPHLNDTRKEGDFQDLCAKTREREKNKRFRRNDYNWNNTKAQDLFKNPWFRNKEDYWADDEVRRNKIEQARNYKKH